MSENVQPPSKGRVVFIRVEPTADTEVAFVTRVVSDTTINVRVMHDDSRSPTHMRGVVYAPPMPPDAKLCKRAPTGWQCSRETGHEGACAAHQVPTGPTWHWPPFVAPKPTPRPEPTAVAGPGIPRS
jgi:hypothetical protein